MDLIGRCLGHSSEYFLNLAFIPLLQMVAPPICMENPMSKDAAVLSLFPGDERGKTSSKKLAMT